MHGAPGGSGWLAALSHGHHPVRRSVSLFLSPGHSGSAGSSRPFRDPARSSAASWFAAAAIQAPSKSRTANTPCTPIPRDTLPGDASGSQTRTLAPLPRVRSSPSAPSDHAGARGGQLQLSGPPPVDCAFPLPRQHPRHRPQGADRLPPAPPAARFQGNPVTRRHRGVYTIVAH